MWAVLASVRAATLFLARDHAANAVFETPLRNYAGAQYVCNITIAGQTVVVIPDTGSFGLLVTSSRCEGCPQQALDVSAAEAAGSYEASAGVEADVSFGSGDAELQLAHAEVALGPTSAANVAIWEITGNDAALEEMWEVAHFQGILGLGWPKEDTNNRTALLTNLGIDQFAFCFGPRLQSPASITFGSVLPDRPQVFAPVVGENHWGVALSDIRYDGGEVGLCGEGQKCAALIDSGTSQILLPPEHVTAVKAMIGDVAPHCENYASLPDLVFKLGEHEVRMSKKAYVRRLKMGGIPRIVGTTDDGRLITEETEVKEFCWLDMSAAIMKSDHGPVWIFGMPFFREHLVSFDRAQRQVGVGEPCHPDDNGTDTCEGDCESEAARIRREAIVSPGIHSSAL